MLESYRVGVSFVMGAGIGQDLSRLIAQMQQFQKEITGNNNGLRQMASAVRNMGGFGPAMERASKAASAMHSAATGMGQAMPGAAKHAEAAATAMERGAAASRVIAEQYAAMARQQQMLLSGPAPMLALPAPPPMLA